MAPHHYLTGLRAGASPIYGQWLARNHQSLPEKAFIAADLHRGKSHLVEPTVLQSAALARVNVTYVHAALAEEPDREAIELGLKPLIPRKNGSGNGQCSAPLSPMEHAAIILDDATLRLVIHDAGRDRVRMMMADMDREGTI